MDPEEGGLSKLRHGTPALDLVADWRFSLLVQNPNPGSKTPLYGEKLYVGRVAFTSGLGYPKTLDLNHLRAWGRIHLDANSALQIQHGLAESKGLADWDPEGTGAFGAGMEQDLPECSGHFPIPAIASCLSNSFFSASQSWPPVLRESRIETCPVRKLPLFHPRSGCISAIGEKKEPI